MESINQPFRVVCINDADKKPEIEDSEWLKKGEEEIVTDVFVDLITGKRSFKLLNKDPHPYKGFTSDRFEIVLYHGVN